MSITLLVRANDGLDGNGSKGQCASCRGKAVVTLDGLTPEMTAALGAGFANPQRAVNGGCTSCGRPFPKVTLHVDSLVFDNEADINAWWAAKS